MQGMNISCLFEQVVVHGLPYQMEWQDLKDLVKPYSSGTVRVDIAKGYDGRSRGYGTVLFDTADDARSCIQVRLPVQPMQMMKAKASERSIID